ncbi:MAG: ABC transporter permease [Candidatus Izemoplasmatales bacterium]|nr:ABC transporter permease [Candidatus Izemoplasmatales bacterium]
MIYDLFNEAIKNLSRSGIKTYLTLLGIIIGIAAIVSLVSIGSGLGMAVEQQLDQLGGKTIFVIPGGFQNIRIKLNETDISNFESIRNVESVVPVYSTSAILEFNGEKINVSVNATDSGDKTLFENTGFFNVKEGRDFTRNESGSILLGSEIAENYFEKKIEIKKLVKINGKDFRVIGILKPLPQSFGGGPDPGNTVLMSLDAFKRISTNLNPTIIFINATDKESVPQVVDDIKDYSDKKYGDKSVNVLRSDNLLETINSLLDMITMFILSLAGISLIVGGIGIMNAMITSVLERTKEIGTLKALGASNNKILTLILIESALIGLIGGIIGILLGFGLAEVIAIIGTQSGFALIAVKSYEIIFGALAFSMIIGMVSGFYPASRAANLDPVEALRYE